MNHTYSPCPSCHAVNKVDRARALEGKGVCGKCAHKLDLHGLVSMVNTQDLKKILKASDQPVVVDFWASWCGPCRSYGPEFEKASTENQRAVFVKINTESEQALSSELGIRSIPCTIVFQGGKEIKRQAGAMNASTLNQWIGP